MYMGSIRNNKLYNKVLEKLMNKKMKALDKASKVNFKFENMDSETQEAIKSLINHLMVKREEKKLKKNEKKT